jgi:hypothetical protein
MISDRGLGENPMTMALQLIVTILPLLTQVAVPPTTKQVAIREPGIYELANLFKQADRVVFVRVVAGDTEAYDVAIYKAEIVKSFKGGAAGGTLYFGPFLGERLGGEYILFLRDVPKPITPKTSRKSLYGLHQATKIATSISSRKQRSPVRLQVGEKGRLRFAA